MVQIEKRPVSAFIHKIPVKSSLYSWSEPEGAGETGSSSESQSMETPSTSERQGTAFPPLWSLVWFLKGRAKQKASHCSHLAGRLQWFGTLGWGPYARGMVEACKLNTGDEEKGEKMSFKTFLRCPRSIKVLPFRSGEAHAFIHV